LSLRDIASTKKRRERFTRTLTGKQVRAMKKRGYDAERELVHMMRSQGWDSVRVPVSAPSTEPLPDVFAVKGNSILAFEVKSQLRYSYYKADQVMKLNTFLKIHKIYPRKYAVLAGKFKYKGWCFSIVERIGDYTLKIGEGLTFKELLSKIT
jgi:holliday junction resolvase Hjr